MQGGSDDVTDSAWADAGVTECFPAADQDGEAAFSLPAQAAEQLVVGAVVGGEPVAVGRLPDRGLDAVTCSFVAGVGQGGEVQFGLFRFLSLGSRFDRVMPDGSKKEVAYSAISPRMILHSNWLSREYVILNYTRYFFGSDTYQPSPPYRQPKPPGPPYNNIHHADENVLSLTAMMAF